MPIRTVGLVGAGGIARAHAPAWQALGVDLLVYSVEGAKDLVTELGYGEVSPSLDDLLSRSDVVDVVTPTDTHPEVVRRALEADRDVICEKPLALSSSEGQSLVDLAELKGRRLFVAHVVRYFQEYRAAKNAVAAGTLGNLAVSRYFRGGSFPAWAKWFAEDERSGGIAMDLMVHDLDYARWLAGPVTRVYATITRSASDGGQPLAYGQATLTHESGAVSLITGAWGAPEASFSSSFHIAGSEGTLSFDSSREESMHFDIPSTGESDQMLPDLSVVESPYLTELRQFVEAIDNDAPIDVTARDGVEAVKIAEAVIESAATGQPVALKGLS